MVYLVDISLMGKERQLITGAPASRNPRNKCVLLYIIYTYTIIIIIIKIIIIIIYIYIDIYYLFIYLFIHLFIYYVCFPYKPYMSLENPMVSITFP